MPGIAVAVGQHHQVARVVVAVHEDRRLRQVVLQDQVEGLAHHLALGVGQLDAFVPRQVPVGKQHQLAVSSSRE